MAFKAIFFTTLVYSLIACSQSEDVLTRSLDLVKDSSDDIFDHKNANFSPPGETSRPDGFWFGTQDLRCVMGSMESLVSWFRTMHLHRKRRSSPTRFALDFTHRLIYYRGMVYEWGVGTRGYYMGTRPGFPKCAITWEATPAGHTNCSQAALAQFARNYRADYGPYNLITNNCHHFANRVSKLLKSPTCSTRPAAWASWTKRFWRYVGNKLRPHI